MSAVPTIEFEQARSPQGLQAIDRACRDHGFFLLRGHGIQDHVDAMWQASAEFFAQPKNTKRRVLRTQEQPLGYYDRELTKRKRDQKEVFDFTLPAKSINQWPDTPAGFKASMDRFYTAAGALSLQLTQLVFDAYLQCQGLPGTIDLPRADTQTSNVRLNFYPLADPLSVQERAEQRDLGDMALHHHTDPGVVTLLLQDAVGGLQTQSLEDGWIDVPADPSAIVVNLGDCMQVWTNDAYRAAVHRVLHVTDEPRYSTPYFLNPSADTVLEPLAALGIHNPGTDRLPGASSSATGSRTTTQTSAKTTRRSRVTASPRKEQTPMSMNGIHHVSINVKDVDTAVTFYTEVLGLDLLDRPDLGFPGAWLRAGEQEVHLLGIDSGEPLKEQHFAFAVQDLEHVRERLQAAGIKCSRPNEIPGVCVQSFTHDPSGNMLEFNQRL